MKKIVFLLAVIAGISMAAGEVWAVGSIDGDGPHGGPSGGASSGGSSGSSGSSTASGSRSKYDLNDAVAAINPDGQDNTVTIGF